MPTPTPPSQSFPQSRIRDNQRRSRARRKEYLLDLETKYRTCSQIGAAASLEIQAAARKVAEENRRLRALLQGHGISDTEMQGHEYAAATPLSEDARMLGAMLSTRKACGDEELRQCSTPPPSSSTRLPMPVSPVDLPRDSMRSLAPYPDPVTRQQSNLWLAPTPQSCGSRCGPSTSPADIQLQLPISPAIPTYALQHASDSEASYLPPSTDLQPQSRYSQPANSGTGTSCSTIASLIRSMNPHLGSELEAELGCADGGECEVSTCRAFEVLDRVSGGL